MGRDTGGPETGVTVTSVCHPTKMTPANVTPATASADALFLEGLGVFSQAVEAVGADGWERPSPCAGWRAVDVLGHVGAAVRFGTATLRLESPTWAPTDSPGEAVTTPPAQWWADLVEPARAAVASADLDQVIDGPTGPRSVREGLSFPAVDLFVHAWDLASSAGQAIEIPEDVIGFAHSLADHMPEALMRNERVFGPVRTSAPDASATAAFLAWTGRDPDWTPPGT